MRRLSRAVADRLLKAARNTPLGGEDGERILVNGVSRLRAQQVVGILATEGATLEILPKIDGSTSDDAAARRSLVHMLAVVLDLEIAPGANAYVSWQKDDLLEILIRLFCDKLFAVLHRGMPRRYVGNQDDLPTLRGRLDVIRQFTVLGATPQKLACQFENLSADIALNQIMKAAVARLTTTSRSQQNRRRLSAAASGSVLAYNGGAEQCRLLGGKADKMCSVRGLRLLVESRCGAVALGRTYLLPLRLAVPQWFHRGSVSTSRSSNRTCRSPASGSRTRTHAFACNAFCSF